MCLRKKDDCSIDHCLLPRGLSLARTTMREVVRDGRGVFVAVLLSASTEYTVDKTDTLVSVIAIRRVPTKCLHPWADSQRWGTFLLRQCTQGRCRVGETRRRRCRNLSRSCTPVKNVTCIDRTQLDATYGWGALVALTNAGRKYESPHVTSSILLVL